MLFAILCCGPGYQKKAVCCLVMSFQQPYIWVPTVRMYWSGYAQLLTTLKVVHSQYRMGKFEGWQCCPQTKTVVLVAYWWKKLSDLGKHSILKSCGWMLVEGFLGFIHPWGIKSMGLYLMSLSLAHIIEWKNRYYESNAKGSIFVFDDARFCTT